MSNVALYEGLVYFGLTILGSLPSIAPYLLPVIYPNSPPEQWQFPSAGAANATTVTQTATFFPKPKTLTDKVYQTIIQTQTATRTSTTTNTVPKTIYATVTEHVTSVSTSIDHHWLTKWTHYPIDPATAYTAVLYDPGATLTSSTPAAEAYPTVATQLSAAVPTSATWFPWRALTFILLVLLVSSAAANILMWYWEPKVIRLSGQLQIAQEAYGTMKRSRADIAEKALAERATLLDRCGNAERSAKLLPGRDAILQGLGVLEADEGELDQKTLNIRSEARLTALIADKQRLEYLELENKAQRTEIRDLKETITTRLYSHYVPGVARHFDDLLKDKQREISNLRRMINTGNVGEAVKKSARLHEEREAELIELRPLRTKVVTLEQALKEAKNETSLVQGQKKTQGVDDERRWNRERDSLRKEQRAKVDALKGKHNSEIATLKSTVNTANGLGYSDLRNDLARADEKSAGLEKNLKLALQQVPDMLAKLKQTEDEKADDNTKCEREKARLRQRITNLEGGKADDEKTCEDNKRQLREKVTELEKALEKATQTQGSQSSAATGNTATNLQSVATTIEADFRDQVHNLSENVQALNTQVATLTQERDTAIGETTEAKSKGEAVYCALQDLNAKDNSGAAAATIAQYQRESVQKDQSIQNLQTENNNQTILISRLRQEGGQEISRRDQKIQQLELDATNSSQTIQKNQQTIASLQQRISSLENDVAAKKSEYQELNTSIQALSRGQSVTIDAASSTQIEALKKDNESLKKDVQAEKDNYLLKVVDLKNEIDDAQRETRETKEKLKVAVESRDEVIAAKIAECKRERQQEIDDLKNSQASSTINSLQYRVEQYQRENTDLKDENSELKEDVKEAWKRLLVRRDDELLAIKKELGAAKNQVKHQQQLTHNFRIRWMKLENNQAFKLGQLTYAEVKEGLLMGSDSEIKDQMKKVLQDNEDLKAEVKRLEDEVEKLWKHNTEEVDMEVEIAEAYESDEE
ncbi:hypothetical protein J4E91_007142 [Alternaria rosae]|nr:hypothetical protein J4E91_007142 [Alternaria rosae]